MRVRRATTVLVELDEQPRFSLAAVLDGSDGLERRARWLVRSAHLDEPVEATLAELAVLEAVPSDHYVCVDALRQRHGDAVDRLHAAGLLLADDDVRNALVERERTARELPWWPAAAIAHVHGRWNGIDLGAREEAGGTLSAAQMLDAFGPPPVADYRRTDSDGRSLGPPRRSAIDAICAARRTCRNFDPEAGIDREALSTVMHRCFAALGTRALAPGVDAVRKNAPAGGGLHAIEAYLLVQRAEPLASGLYHYVASEHTVEPLQALPTADAAELAYRVVAGQHWFAAAAVMIVLTARHDRLFWKYRRHSKAWRVTQLDAGHLSQLVYLTATELGLGAFVTCAVNDLAIEQALGLDPLREGVVVVCGIGQRTGRLGTLEMTDLTPTAAAAIAGGPASEFG